MYTTRDLRTNSSLTAIATIWWTGALSSAFFIQEYLLWQVLAQFCLVAVLLSILHLTVEQYAFTESKCNFTVVFFLAVSAGIAQFCIQPAAALSSLLCLFAYRLLFDCYRQEQCNSQIFHAFFLIACASLIVPPLVWLIPVLWLACGLINEITLGRFLSSVAGIAMLVWVVWGVLFITDNLESIYDFVELLRNGFLSSKSGVFDLGWELFAAFGMYILVMCVAFFSFLSKEGKRLSVRKFTLFLYIVWFGLMVLSVLYPSFASSLFCLSIVPFSIAVGQFYYERDNLFTRILFAFFVAALAACFISVF